MIRSDRNDFINSHRPMPAPRERAGAVAGLVCGLVLSGTAVPLHGQHWQVDATAAGVGADTAALVGSASVTPALEWRARTLFGRLSAGLTGFEGSQWAAQGRADLSVVGEPFGVLHPVRFEAVGFGQATYHSSDFRTVTSRVETRVHISSSRIGGWVGALGGTGWASTDADLLAAIGGSAGLWVRSGPVQVLGSVSPIRLDGVWFSEVAGRLGIRHGALDLTGYVGWRDAAAGVEDDLWGGGIAQWWFTDRVALMFSGGRYGSDILQGLPGGRYLSVGIRLARGRPDVSTHEPLFRPVYTEDADGFRGLRFDLDAGAEAVAVVGEWTGWEPVPMTPVPGRPGTWELAVDLPSGAYRFNLVLDGEEWIVPDGVMAVPDGYGGSVGVLVIP